jgi:uncharacterized protein
VWGVPLLLLRRASVRTLVIVFVLLLPIRPLINITRKAYMLEMKGRAAMVDAARSRSQSFIAARARHDSTELSTNARTVIAGRIAYMPHFQWQWNVYPDGAFLLFLIGLIGFRLGIYHDPARHRRLITGLMIGGIVTWSIAVFVLPVGKPPVRIDDPAFSIPAMIASIARANAFRMFRDEWIAITYIGAVLLFMSRRRVVPRLLEPLRDTGRMALTNYLSQVIVLDLAFSAYAFNRTLTPRNFVFAALALFAVQAVISRWWLQRYNYGPLEWLWRWGTYIKRPRFRH